MSASPKLQEPSMEEILASIRRIITDDRGHGAGDASDEDVPDRNVVPEAPEPVRSLGLDDAEPGDEAPSSSTAGGAAQPEPAADAQALMSRATDASVGQAFGALAHTVISASPRPIEEIVREMLRPMLRTWLDENLPTIVERLVRAEIERVARGRR